MVGAVDAGLRFAPPDPALPPPWRALVDGSTGYVYYWNTETNVTQYEKPMPPPQALSLPPGPPSGTPALGAGTKQSNQQADMHSRHPSNLSGLHGTRPGDQQSLANGNVLPSAVVVPHETRPSANNANVHGSHNLHGTRSAHVIQANTANNVSENMYGNSGHECRGPPSHAQGSAGSGSGNGMAAGPVHMNSSDPYGGGGGRQMHSNSANTEPRGPLGGRVHSGAPRTSHNVPVNLHIQPNLAALPVPQKQQVTGGMPMPNQPWQLSCPQTNLGHPSSALHESGPPTFKRATGDYSHNVDPQRPRVQNFLEPLPNLDVASYLKQHEITAVGESVPPPFMTFEAANFPPEISRELYSAGFVAPTPIQAQSWSIALQNRDIVAIAKTGSGKTLGYLLPAFLHLRKGNRGYSHAGPVVLVLAPTRELATQIQDEALKFGRSSSISCTCVYGGASKSHQLRELDRGADIVIATPGRLNDILEMKRISLQQVSYLVLDEADRMLDMGFEPQIRKIVKEIPSCRQTLMFTATWPKEVKKIAADLLVSPVQVNIGNTDQLVANKAITQHIEFVPAYEKHRRLEQILRSQEPGSKVIIFCSTKKMCDQLARTLGRAFGAVAIHGDKSQPERDHVLAQFKVGRNPVLVATDVAARGLDIKDIRVVINFDFPTGVEDYVHRIGRTGRAGATGVAFTFFSEQDSKHARELIGVLEGANQKVPMELHDLAAKAYRPRGRANRWEVGGNETWNFAAREGYAVRGPVGAQGGYVGQRERMIDRFNDRDRFPEKSGGWDRSFDDRNRGRDAGRRVSSKERGHSYSRSYSRSPVSYGRSRSRSCSQDRYSDDCYRHSPPRGEGLYRSRSPHQSRSPRMFYRSPPQGHGKQSNAVCIPDVPLPENNIDNLDESADKKPFSKSNFEQHVVILEDRFEDLSQRFNQEKLAIHGQANDVGAVAVVENDLIS